jgi:hypothetical protein
VRAPARLSIGLVLIGALAWSAPGVAAAAGVFADWAAVVVAGDSHAHGGGPSEVFDNARRDLVRELIARGFSPNHVLQFSVQPERYPQDGAQRTDAAPIVNQLGDLAQTARGGCLVYFTSHGSPEGILVGSRTWTPNMMASVIDSTCGARPAVVILSSCFSGVFVPILADANRMILTAARPDRTSFGCGEADHYTYFDACVLQELGVAHDFAVLGRAVQACVAKREHDMSATPPSEPQMEIGAALRPMLPLFAFSASR